MSQNRALLIAYNFVFLLIFVIGSIGIPFGVLQKSVFSNNITMYALCCFNKCETCNYCMICLVIKIFHLFSTKTIKCLRLPNSSTWRNFYCVLAYLNPASRSHTQPHPATPKRLMIEYPVAEVTLCHWLISGLRPTVRKSSKHQVFPKITLTLGLKVAYVICCDHPAIYMHLP